MKKGFTLIELLAVIVILAIIALIATPIILNIVEDSKKSAATESARLYVDGLQNRIASENMTREYNPTSCTITNGNITCDGQSLDYAVDGQAPTSGTISFNNGVISGYTLGISGYTVTKNGSVITTTKGEPTPATYTMGQLLQYDPVNNTSCTTGNTCYKWRVITIEDTASNETITLQMDHNLINTIAWVTSADYYDDENSTEVPKNYKGPITAFKALETATASWDNSLKLNYSYNDSELMCTNGACIVDGNQITANLKARMITVEEIAAMTVAVGADEETNAYDWQIGDGLFNFSSTVNNIGSNTYSDENAIPNTELSWLLENTWYDYYSCATDNTYDDNVYGYWTLTPSHFGSDGYVWSTYYEGYISGTSVYDDWAYGVRPVITISKTVLQ